LAKVFWFFFSKKNTFFRVSVFFTKIFHAAPMPTKTLNRPQPAASSQGVSLESIIQRLPASERDAIRTRTAEMLLGSALKNKLAENGGHLRFIKK
jgi:hypothetical protein